MTAAFNLKTSGCAWYRVDVFSETEWIQLVSSQWCCHLSKTSLSICPLYLSTLKRGMFAAGLDSFAVAAIQTSHLIKLITQALRVYGV